MPSLPRSRPLDLAGRRIFITGGTGFVGRTLLDYIGESIATHGQRTEVCVLSRDPARFQHAFPRYGALPWLRFIAGDVVTGITRPVGRFTDVIHAAADTHAVGDCTRWIDQIVGGTRAALDFACSAGAQRFLLTSSGAVYGRQPREVAQLKEDHTGAPPTDTMASVYGQSKRLAEQLCTVYRHERGLQTVVARCFAFVGEHVPLDGPYAIGNFIRDALRADRISVKGDGTAVRTYLYGRDMAHWLLTLLLRAEGGSCYNVGSDQPVAMLDLATQVAACLSPGKPVVVERFACADNGRSIYVPNIDKARQLGLTVETRLIDAIEWTAKSCPAA